MRLITFPVSSAGGSDSIFSPFDLGTADVDLLVGEVAFAVAANVAIVAFVRFDQ
jgi:hypothetical protein